MDEHVDSFSWNKMVQNANKVGFREGVEDGKTLLFQKGFDQGFENGYKNGFDLGKLKGLLKVNNKSEDPILEKTRRGNCKVCSDETLLDKTIDEIKEIQNKSTKEVIQKLYSTFNENYDYSSIN